MLASVLLALLAVGPARAQDPQFRHLGTDDGLANVWVQTILEDSRGFMWFGTVNGLNRYDGYRMATYRHDATDPSSVADSRINQVYEDRSGTLWIASRSGLSRYDRSLDRFHNFMVQSWLDLAARRRVYAVLEDSRGTFWVGTSEGLFQFDRASGQATPYRLPAGRAKVVVQTIVEDRRKRLWIGTQSTGLFELDPASGRVQRHGRGVPGSRVQATDVKAIVEDAQGRLWLGTYGDGLVRLDPRDGSTRQYRHDPRDSTSLAIDRIRALVIDPRGMLWIGTENAGLDGFDPVTGRFRHNRADVSNPWALTSNSFWSLYLDSSGRLWAGVYTGGLNVLTRWGQGIRHIKAGVGDSALSANSVLGFAQDSAGIVWVVATGGGLDRFDPRTGAIRHHGPDNSGLDSRDVLAVTVGHQGPTRGVWLGTWGAGIRHFDPATNRFTRYDSRNTDLPNDNIFSMHVDRRGRLWVGTWQDGLLEFDPARRSFARHPIGKPGAQSQIWLIHELHDGRLALGTLENGLLLFDPATKRMTRFGTDPGAALRISAYEVRALLESEPGVLWVGTAAGLDRLDLRRNSSRRLGEKDGLPSSMISGLARGEGGRLWVSTDQGIANLDPRTGQSYHYTAADGVLGRELNPRAYLRTREGLLLFGGENGFNVIEPRLLVHNARKPPVVLTDFQLFNRPVEIGGRGSPLQAAISETRSLTLAHDQSVFSLEFAALDYTAPSKNRYAYMLEGFDRDWTQAGATNMVTYTGLPPGEYLFRVKGSNNDGVWNDVDTALRITITPPFWATWWFRLLVLVVVGGTVAAVVQNARARHHYL
ncbi:MAG TPA: two-component regulator propeller domain-containing protein, partial [Gemmatimonadaceae bacterium]|nr:two-component regulator propeller domain-containing protein [Gemmatimonadaceae bacterium]